MNNTIRKYPRTLEQAFGPGHRTLDDVDEPIDGLGFIGLGISAVSLVLGVSLVAGLLAGWIFGGSA